jgi:hypothetical protein
MGFRNRVLDSVPDLRKDLDRLQLAISKPEPDVQESWYALVDLLGTVQYCMGELLSDGYPKPPHEHVYCYQCGGRLDRIGPRDCPTCRDRVNK